MPRGKGLPGIEKLLGDQQEYEISKPEQYQNPVFQAWLKPIQEFVLLY